MILDFRFLIFSLFFFFFLLISISPRSFCHEILTRILTKLNTKLSKNKQTMKPKINQMITDYRFRISFLKTVNFEKKKIEKNT